MRKVSSSRSSPIHPASPSAVLAAGAASAVGMSRKLALKWKGNTLEGLLEGRGDELADLSCKSNGQWAKIIFGGAFFASELQTPSNTSQSGKWGTVGRARQRRIRWQRKPKFPPDPFSLFALFRLFLPPAGGGKKRGARGEGKKLLPPLPFLQAFFHPLPYRHYPLPPPHTLRLFALLLQLIHPTFSLLPAGVAQAIRPLPALLAATTRQRRQQQRTGRRRKGERRRRRWRWKERGNERRRGGCAKKGRSRRRRSRQVLIFPESLFSFSVPPSRTTARVVVVVERLTGNQWHGCLPRSFCCFSSFTSFFSLSRRLSLRHCLLIPTERGSGEAPLPLPLPPPSPNVLLFSPLPFPNLPFSSLLHHHISSLLRFHHRFFSAPTCVPEVSFSPPFSDRCRVPFSSFSLLILLLLPPTFQFWKGKKSREGKARPREERQRKREEKTHGKILSLVLSWKVIHARGRSEFSSPFLRLSLSLSLPLSEIAKIPCKKWGD